VGWFNNRRLLAPIGNIPPAEAEERYSVMPDDTPMAASFNPNGLRQSQPPAHQDIYLYFEPGSVLSRILVPRRGGVTA
jgi:hypothetical protein